MKIKCSKVNLLNSLNIVSKAVSTKTTLPILECILIDVYADSIKLTANDLEIGIETILDGEVIEMGRIAIEAKHTMYHPYPELHSHLGSACYHAGER